MSTITIGHYQEKVWSFHNIDDHVLSIPIKKHHVITKAIDHKGIMMTSAETWKILSTIGAAFVLGMVALWTFYDKLDTKIDRVEVRIEGKLGAIDTKIDRVEAKIEGKLHTIRQDMNTMKQDINTMKTDIHGINMKLDKR